MIHSINLRLLRNAEYLQFLRLFLQLLHENDPVGLKVDEQIALLESEFAGAEELFKLPLSSEKTEYLLAYDQQRDAALIGIGLVIKGYLNHYDPVFVAAAKILDTNLSLYGNRVYRMNYQAETASITGIVKDWENKDNLVDAVSLLGLEKWKDKLKKYNIDFEKMYNSRTREYGAENQNNLGRKREDTNLAYSEVVKYLQAYNTIDKTGAYTAVINEINALIDQYNTLLAARKPGEKEENEEKKSDESPE